MERRSLGKTRKELLNYEIDEDAFIYKDGVKLPFSRTLRVKGKTLDVVRLLARTFLDNPGNCQIIIFKDGNSDNIKLENLAFSYINQESYNLVQVNLTSSEGKYCKICLNFHPYEDYNCNAYGNKINVCKDCVKARRDLKKDEYNERKRLRVKNQPNNRFSVYYKKNYDKLKNNPEEYRKFLEKTAKYNTEKWWIQALSRIKRRALDNKLPFNLVAEDLKLPEDGLCPILRIPISVKNPSKMNCVSWDKIIPELGYIKGNVRAISNKANIMKSNCSFEELEIFCQNILKYIKHEL